MRDVIQRSDYRAVVSFGKNVAVLDNLRGEAKLDVSCFKEFDA
jgi:hypothetical protein